MFSLDKINQYLSDLSLNGSSTETVRAYRNDLVGAHNEIGDRDEWPELEVAMAQYLTAHRGTWAPKTTQRRLGTLRSWARWAGAPTGFLGAYRPPKPAPPQPHPIPEGIAGVLAMIGSTRNPRHKALCALTGLMGLRVSEAIAVRPEHFNLDEMTLTVRGKGDKTRVVPVSGAAWKALERAHRLAIENDTTVTRLSSGGARRAVSRHARKAGLSKHVASHDMRATFATAAYGKTKNLRAVQELLGHSDSKTTQIYTAVSMSDMRDASEVAS